MSALLEPRGIRNCNPGNIRREPGVTWHGQSPTQFDNAFVQFDDAVYGIRAIAKIMRSYEREGINTIQAAINRWAPPVENDSAAYVAAVCKGCSVSPETVISLDSVMPQLVRAIILHENGVQPYTDTQITQGVLLA